MVLWWAALILVLGGVLLLWLGARQQRRSGLPPGRVLYSDPQIIGQPERPLFDADTLLTGKPDYLVKEGSAVIPVEVKSGWAPPEPHPGHVFQLMAYCRLVERSMGVRPPYGILRYRNRTFAIDYTPQAEAELLALIEEIHAAGGREQHRSHDSPARCAGCGFRSQCDQRLG